MDEKLREETIAHMVKRLAPHKWVRDPATATVTLPDGTTLTERELKSSMWPSGASVFEAVATVREIHEGRREYIVCMLDALTVIPRPHALDLTPWEADFVASVADQFDRRGTLTDKQMETLERIYAEKAE